MFFLSYLRAELGRRRGRTILTVLGLAVGVGLVVATSALGAGLDKAQKQVLGPLSGVATDLTVTKRNAPFAAGGPADAVFGGSSSLSTDLSKLGKAGDKFETDTFFSTQGSITAKDLSAVKATPHVTDTSEALVLQGIHQKGTIPKITAKVQTGGETVTQAQKIDPMTQAEQDAFNKCLQANGINRNDGGGASTQQGPPDGGGGGPTFRQDFGAFNKCLPERFKNGVQRFVVPRREIQQDVNTPSTDINSSSYTIAGIDPSATINIISPSQVTDGSFLAKSSDAMLSTGYADKNKLKVGSTITLKTTKFSVVGLVKAPLAGTSADIYVPKADLQKVSGRTGDSNVLLARTDNASNVKSASSSIENNVPGANVSDASDLAQDVAGSLVDSGNLIHRLALALAVLGLVAAVVIAALLTLSSVSKRTRELGTLKAIGWRPGLVVRQIVGESAIQGVLGGIVGVALGIGAAALLGTFGLSLTARSVANGGPGRGGVFGFGRFADGAHAASQAVKLTAPVSLWILLLAAGLAVLGGLVAGAIGATRAARLRPADAMREVG